jgi:hypothetical protein
MVVLPIEILRQIVAHLELQALKSARQVSRVWGLVGEEYLMLPTFTCLPHRPDILRLEEICQHHTFRHQIRALKFNHAKINEYHARHNIYFLQFTMEPEAKAPTQESTWAAYLRFKALREQHFPESCEPERLTRVFSKLCNLKTVHVESMGFPFPGEKELDLLEQVWKIPSTRHPDRTLTADRFSDILSALALNLEGVKLDHLSHDRLPFQFFTQLQSTLDQVFLVVNNLKSLSLGIDFHDESDSIHYTKGIQNISNLLGSATQLEHLSLIFYGRRKFDISPMFRHILDAEFEFEKLTYLTIQSIITTEAELGDFITALPTLKDLQLGGPGLRAPHQPANGGIHLDQGSFNGLFDRLNSEMKLDCLLVQGDLIGGESGERWVLDDIEEQRNLKEYVID